MCFFLNPGYLNFYLFEISYFEIFYFGISYQVYLEVFSIYFQFCLNLNEVSHDGVCQFHFQSSWKSTTGDTRWLWNYFRTLEYRIIYYRLIHQQILTGVLLFSPLFCYILSCLFFNFQEVQLKSDRSSAQQYFVFVLCVFVAGNLINVLMCYSLKWSMMYRHFFPGIAYNWNQNSTRLIE